MALPATASNTDASAFPTTQWSAGQRADAAGEAAGRAALTELCSGFWYLVCAFVRRCRFSPHDAQDCTQGSFIELIEGRTLVRAVAGGGHFRSYLLGTMQNFLANEKRRRHTAKRGGLTQFIWIDDVQGENRCAIEPPGGITLQTQFEQSSAIVLLERVLVRLAAHHEKAGRTALFATLQRYLAGKEVMPGYENLGRKLAMSNGAVAVAIRRMRGRDDELLRDEIAHPVASPEEEAEFGYLLQVVARG